MKSLLYILLLAVPGSGYGQVVAVQGGKQIAYICGFNSVKAAVENCPASQLVVTCNNGKLVYDHERYCFLPDAVGEAKIYVSRKTMKGIKMLDSTIFKVEFLPAIPMLNGKNGGTVTHKALWQSIGLSAYIGEIGCSAGMGIVGFDVSVLRENKEIFHSSVPAGHGQSRFDNETQAFFRKLHNNDKLLFTNIALRECKEPRYLKPMEFIITDEEQFPEHGQEQMEDPVTGEIYIKKW